MISIIVLAHNIRSAHNIGSIFRTCEGLGVAELWCSGYTPYPDMALSPLMVSSDSRLPHIRRTLTDHIHKTALGAETAVPFRYDADIQIKQARQAGYHIVALEQSASSIPLPSFHATQNIALIIGEERYGITEDILAQCDTMLEIPMYGHKESFNVSVATGIALYQLRIR